MIAVVDVAVQAANVSMPLYPWRAFRNSYSSVRVRNVPRKIGKWNITNVTVQVTYPDGSIKTADAVLTGGVWVATVEGTATAGTSIQGYKILASGIDENGQPVSNYCLGRGDVTILEDDGELIPENVITYTRLLSSEPSQPKDGDLWNDDGSWFIYQDGTSYPIGDDSGLIQQLSSELSTKADVSSLTAYELTANMYSDVSSIVLSTETTESWDYQIPQSVVELGYTINSLEYIESEQLWHLDLTIDRESWTWYSNNQQTDTNLTFDEGNAANEFGIIYASWNTTTRNVLGLAMASELSGKADISALSGCLHLYSAQPTSPKEGDVWKDTSNGDYVVWQNNKTNSLGANRTWVWNTFERKSDMQRDVGNIVTEKTTSDWNCPENVNGFLYAKDTDWLDEHGDTSKTYYVLVADWNATGDDNWLITFTRYEWFETSEFSSWQPLQPLEDVVDAPEDTLSLPCSFDDGQGFSCSFTITRTLENTLGLAMESELSDYATKTYAVHNLSGVANAISMPLSSYESISATADAETLYVITED